MTTLTEKEGPSQLENMEYYGNVKFCCSCSFDISHMLFGAAGPVILCSCIIHLIG